jgi:phosphate:Na+ symporter
MSIDFSAMVVVLLGGLALFLLGMDTMTGALRMIAGPGLRNALRRLTGNRVAGALTGAGLTAVIQSSSITTVLVVGFVSAGLLTMQQSVAVILGANVGTTVTAQIVAFRVTDFALGMIALGFLFQLALRRQSGKTLGTIVLGLGLVFFGMKLMSDATAPLQDYEPFTRLMSRMDKPALGMLVGAAFTALVQSSSATTAIVIVLAGSGFITLEAGIALVIGSNIGTCATALLASIGKPVEAVRVAVVHVLFNVVGALLWFPFLWLLADVVRRVSPVRPDLEGVARLAAETPRQIANAHTFFNVFNTLLFIWFTGPLARLAIWLTPAAKARERAEPKYLDDALLDTPALAVERVHLEIVRMGEIVLEIVRGVSLDRHDPEVEKRLLRLQRAVHDVEALDGAILAYARRLLARNISTAEAARLETFLAATTHIQSIADVLGVNLAALGEQWRQRGLHASEDTARQARELFGVVAGAVERAFDAFRDNNSDEARAVIALKPEVSRRADALNERITNRLRAESPDRVAIYRAESELIEIFRHVFYFAKRLAKIVAGEHGVVSAPAPGAEPSTASEA